MNTCVVLDTNVVLDLLVFSDPGVRLLRSALESGHVRWLATETMRQELIRVMGYPRVAPQMATRALTTSGVLADFDQLSVRVADAPLTTCRCADADDQMFVDLAVQHGALLLSKDAAVLALKRSMQEAGARVLARWPSDQGGS